MRPTIALCLLALLACAVWMLAGEADPWANGHTPPQESEIDTSPGQWNALDTAANAREAAPIDLTGSPWNLLITAAESGASLPGAVVYHLPAEFNWSRLRPEEKREAEGNLEAFLRAKAGVLVADVGGRCNVPVGKHGVQVFAYAEERFASDRIPPGRARTTVLALRPDRTLHVRVVDVSGRGVPQASIISLRKEGHEQREAFWGRTDEEGLFVRRHCQSMTPDGATLELAAKVPGCLSSSVVVDCTKPPPELVLRLPATGEVIVDVQDASGHPINPDYLRSPLVHLVWSVEGSTRTERRGAVRGLLQLGNDRPLAPGGRATFNHVALGGHVRVFLDPRRFVQAEGPSLNAPRVHLVLSETAADVVLTAMLRGPDGAALASREFKLQCKCDAGGMSKLAQTDAEGRLRVRIGELFAGPLSTLTLGAHSESLGQISAELPSCRLHPGLNDIGEIRLRATDTLVAGRIICDSGVDIDRVPITVHSERQGGWSPVVDTVVKWSSGGHFEIRGEAPAESDLRLEVAPGPYLQVDPIRFTAGATAVDIRLGVAGTVTARLAVGVETPIDLLSFALDTLTKHGDRETRKSRAATPSRLADADHTEGNRYTLNWCDLEPGLYEVVVRCAGIMEPVLRIGPLQVQTGRCKDPRLADIDLRGLLGNARVEVRRPDGRLLQDADSFIVVRSAEHLWHGFNLSTGLVSMTVPHALDARIVAPGFVTANLTIVPGHNSVTLETLQECRIEVTGATEVSEDATLLLRLHPAVSEQGKGRIKLDTGGDMLLESFYSETARVERGIVTLYPRWAGMFRAKAMLVIEGKDRPAVLDITPATFPLPDMHRQLSMNPDEIRRILGRR